MGFPKRWVWKIVGLIVLAGVLWPPRVSAQDDPHEKNRIYTTGALILNVCWTPDSSHLVYQIELYDNIADRPINGPNTPNDDTWRQYSVATGQTSRGTTWPLQPDLTPQQFNDFDIFHNGDDHSFVYASPNRRYLVYSAQVPANAGYGLPLGVADLSNNSHRILDSEQGVYGNDFPGDFLFFSILWSEDSSAFTLDSGFGRHLYYISQLDDLDSLVVQLLNPYEGLPLGDSTFRAGAIFDLSADGNLVLMQGGDLVIWDVVNNSGTGIHVEGIVAGAIFTPDEQSILFVDEDGLKRYTIAINEVTLLNSDINSVWGYRGAYFSPNGAHVAIVADDWESLYLFEVPEIGDVPDDDSE